MAGRFLAGLFVISLASISPNYISTVAPRYFFLSLFCILFLCLLSCLNFSQFHLNCGTQVFQFWLKFYFSFSKAFTSVDLKTLQPSELDSFSLLYLYWFNTAAHPIWQLETNKQHPMTNLITRQAGLSCQNGNKSSDQNTKTPALSVSSWCQNTRPIIITIIIIIIIVIIIIIMFIIIIIIVIIMIINIIAFKILLLLRSNLNLILR